jgi:nucleotide-binding universal stress UspA family protein
VSRPFSNVLLATQGTSFDAGAERVAIDLAARLGIGLRVVLPVVSNPEYESMAPLLGDRSVAEAASWLDALREAARAKGVELTGAVRPGAELSREIVAEALERGADLLVMRRRGRRSYLANLLFGQMVRAATGHAPCDVLIVPQESDLWSHCIVLATDGSPHARRAADLAASIAVAFALPLRVVSAALRQDADAEAAAHVERALAAIAAAGAHATGRVVDGRPEEAILRCAREIGADLIVLGRRGMNRAARALIGSTTEKVAGQANGPVLIVRAE